MKLDKRTITAAVVAGLTLTGCTQEEANNTNTATSSDEGGQTEIVDPLFEGDSPAFPMGRNAPTFQNYATVEAITKALAAQGRCIVTENEIHERPDEGTKTIQTTYDCTTDGDSGYATRVADVYDYPTGEIGGHSRYFSWRTDQDAPLHRGLLEWTRRNDVENPNVRERIFFPREQGLPECEFGDSRTLSQGSPEVCYPTIEQLQRELDVNFRHFQKMEGVELIRPEASDELKVALESDVKN